MDPDDLPKPKPQMVIGEKLDNMGLAELEQRLVALDEEITRVRAEMARKQSGGAAADALFKPCPTTPGALPRPPRATTG